MSESANAAGACLAGSLPNRVAAGQASDKTGENVLEILSAQHQVLLTMGIDPVLDIGNGPKVKAGLEQQDFIIALSSFDNDFIRETADLVLPLASFLETSGTYVNAEGLWQSFKGCYAAVGESRQGWKILTALARLLLPNDDYSYANSRAVRDELKEQCRELELSNFVGFDSSLKLPTRPRSVQRISEMAIYASDEICRNSQPLQATVNMQQASAVRINLAQAEKLGLGDAEQVHVEQDGGTAILSLIIDENVPAGCAWIPSGIKAVENLGAFHGSVTLEKLS
jgi:NADH-quinone oxidoreductase subunit G